MIEVILGPGKKGNIVMRKGENPDNVARKFADKYELNKDVEALLKELLEKELLKTDGLKHN